jgi:hypothetical protein
MNIQIRSKKDWYAGLMFVAWGLFFALGATRYRMGTAAKMGPGYFPFSLGCLLAVIGTAVLFGSLGGKGPKEQVGRLYWRPLILLVASIGAFALLLNSFGVVVALTALIGISSFASTELKLKETVLSIAILTFGAIAIFSWGLKLQFPIWPRFLGL